MSFRSTIILVIILILLVGFISYNRLNRKIETEPELPEVWSLNPDTISRIEIHLPKLKKGAAFLKKDQDSWIIDDTDQTPVSPERWGGIVLLLSGPQAKRLISERAEDITRYGFSDPNIIVKLYVDGPKETLKILVGDRTPDDKSIYAMLSSYQTVYLLDRTWSDTIERLVLDPPRQEVRSVRTSK
ncbi:MAG: DUF4340 domain-containing protein [Deltaproteobacteria bacterium]|nr:DUF4340 domain-containing protein [Deltaproteobacteria bacterium]